MVLAIIWHMFCGDIICVVNAQKLENTMGYKNFVSMNIAIIGTQQTAEIFSAGLAMAGHEVYVARKEGDKTVVSPVLNSFTNIHFCSIEQASAASDIIIVASPPGDVREIAYWLGDVRGKVVIDITSNVYTGNDPELNTLGAIKAITGSANVVKVFSTRAYQQVVKPLLGNNKIQLLMAGDCSKSKDVARIIAEDVGIRIATDMGGEQEMPLMDYMTRSWYDLKMKLAKTNSKHGLA